MACHGNFGQLKPDGYYWVKIHYIEGKLKEDWHLAEVRTGHFRWVLSMGGNIPLAPITLAELVKQKVPMILIKKPKQNS